jgi:hypothetical protein
MTLNTEHHNEECSKYVNSLGHGIIWPQRMGFKIFKLQPEEKHNFKLHPIKKKKESCPATRHEGAWGERRYSSYSFLTSALDGGEWSASCPSRTLPPGKGPPVPIGQEAGVPWSWSGHRG